MGSATRLLKGMSLVGGLGLPCSWLLLLLGPWVCTVLPQVKHAAPQGRDAAGSAVLSASPPWRGALGSPAEMGKGHFKKSFGGGDRLDKGYVFYSGWRGQQSCDQQLGKEAETVGLR